MTDRPTSAPPKRRRSLGDVLYFAFQTLPAIVAVVILTVATIAYALIRWVLP